MLDPFAPAHSSVQIRVQYLDLHLHILRLLHFMILPEVSSMMRDIGMYL